MKFLQTMKAKVLGLLSLGAVGATNAFAITAADVPVTDITADIGIVFISLLTVALAVFGVQKVVRMF